MTWVRLDDLFPDHPKVQRVSDHAAWMFVCGLCYCARLRTDGVIPEAAVTTLTHARKPMVLAEELVEVGLWDRGDREFLVHDFLEYNPSSAKLAERRTDATVRKRSQRDRQRDRVVTGARPLTGARDGSGNTFSETTTELRAGAVCPTPPSKPAGNPNGYAVQAALLEWQPLHDAYLADLAAFAAEHFPGAQVGMVEHCVKVCARNGVEPTVENLAPIVARDGMIRAPRVEVVA